LAFFRKCRRPIYKAATTLRVALAVVEARPVGIYQNFARIGVTDEPMLLISEERLWSVMSPRRYES
jgi:hypothetical protein